MIETFTHPYPWQTIDHTTQTTGAAILKGALPPTVLHSLNAEIDSYLEASNLGLPATGSRDYDKFLGHNTIRMHGLIEKFPSSSDIIGDTKIVDWANRTMGPLAGEVLLNAGELIEIRPGEPRQQAHRDSDSWPIPLNPHPFIVNAIYALDDFTEENGATWIAPDSWRWPKEQRAETSDYVRAVMKRGDAIIFRGDLIHRGGANDSDKPRRALSISYCAGWLRTVENTFMNHSLANIRGQSEQIKALLGFGAYDGQEQQSGMLGLYENGAPGRYLEDH